jgi:hypothetical protein
MDDHDSQPRAPGYRTGRMEAFSDGVFAIAVTLLVLEIAVPAGSGDDLPGSLGDQRPSYLGYVVSSARNTSGSHRKRHVIQRTIVRASSRQRPQFGTSEPRAALDSRHGTRSVDHSVAVVSLWTV